MDTQPKTFAEKIAASSQVRHVEYDSATGQLHVVFRRTPALYVYSGFTPEHWAEMQGADSIGSYLYKNVTRAIDGKLPFEFVKRELPDHLKEVESAS